MEFEWGTHKGVWWDYGAEKRTLTNRMMERRKEQMGFSFFLGEKFSSHTQTHLFIFLWILASSFLVFSPKKRLYNMRR